MRSPLAWSFDRAIAAYQFVRADRPSPCRHVPSCSVYGREAIEVHGALKGGWFTLRRIGRCNPWGSEGHDPVPPARSRRADAGFHSSRTHGC